MPIYEYVCERGHLFERVVRTSAAEPLEFVMCEHELCLHALSRKCAKLIPSQTGVPILKRGIGGFFKPSD